MTTVVFPQQKVTVNVDHCESEPAQQEEQSLDFAVLPERIIRLIAKKLNYKDYVQLEETSRCTATVLSNCDISVPYYSHTIFVNKSTIMLSLINWYYDRYLQQPRVPWHVATVKARIEAEFVEISYPASSSRMKAVAKLFEENGTRTTTLQIVDRVEFKPEDLDRLINVLRVVTVDFLQFLPREFFLNPDNGLNLIGENLFLHTNGCTDEDFLKLKVPSIHMTSDFITDRGINQWLKQWKRKEREITWLYFIFGETLGARNFDTILEGLDANPIWTPDLHEHSLVGAIKLEEFELMKRGEPELLYSIWRADSPEDMRMIYLTQKHLSVSKIGSETVTLLGYLTDDQYYAVRRTCLWCNSEFCEHRRRYSRQRFKEFFPRTNDAISSGIRAASAILAAAQCAQLLIGSIRMDSNK